MKIFGSQSSLTSSRFTGIISPAGYLDMWILSFWYLNINIIRICGYYYLDMLLILLGYVGIIIGICGYYYWDFWKLLFGKFGCYYLDMWVLSLGYLNIIIRICGYYYWDIRISLFGYLDIFSGYLEAWLA